MSNVFLGWRLVYPEGRALVASPNDATASLGAC
jgi:hypothetical protein